MNKFKCGLLIIGGVLIVLGSVFVSCTPNGIALFNSYTHTLRTADDATNYETKKKVEDTCRSMIASYNTDKLTYEQYKNSESSEQRGWADAAKMRANKTASTYNNYIIKNNYIWKNDVPSDIYMSLTYID